MTELMSIQEAVQNISSFENKFNITCTGKNAPFSMLLTDLKNKRNIGQVFLSYFPGNCGMIVCNSITNISNIPVINSILDLCSSLTIYTVNEYQKNLIEALIKNDWVLV